MTAPTTINPRATGWDRAAVIALGAAGSALSYDALQQMATAIHVRGWLTYLYPLVIDGFIAYGVRALLVLRTAPLRARFYVWTLFGGATAASLWANALHAVRLNQQHHQPGLSLGDTAVGVLSTLAPLALAGAVHLYILVARNAAPSGHPGRVTSFGSDQDRDQDSSATGQLEVTRLSALLRSTDEDAVAPVTGPGEVTDPQPTPALTPRTGQAVREGEDSGQDNRPGQFPAQGAGHRIAPGDRWVTAPTGTGQPGHAESEHTRSADPDSSVTADRSRPRHRPVARPGEPDSSSELGGQQPVRASDGPSSGPTIYRSPAPAGVPLIRPVTGHRPAAGADRGGQPVTDRRGSQDIEEMLPIARAAVERAGRVTRAVVGQAVRSQDIPLSSDRLTVLMQRLRADKASGQAPLTAHRDSDLDSTDSPAGQPGGGKDNNGQDSGTVD